MTPAADIPVVLLCGGLGLRLDDSGQRKPKALVRVAGRPMVAHLVAWYARFGFRRFLFASGEEPERIEREVREALRDHRDLALSFHPTGAVARTGERLRALAHLLDGAPQIAVSYSDTLADVDLRQHLAFHEGHEKLASLIGVHIPTRFRVLGMRYGDPAVRGFVDKPVILTDYINGGFYFFRPEILGADDLGSDAPGLTLETTVLERLAREGQLMARLHRGQWQHLDHERDLPTLESIAASLAESTKA